MKLKRLIAESGGTKTDWFGLDAAGEKVLFSTESYHPLHINDEFRAKQQKFWSAYDLSECILHFYGAGCLQEENKNTVAEFLSACGFKDPIVASDLFAADRALGEHNGMVAICGTGSAIFSIQHDQLVELRGGLGWETGDEGSGFYFGKLVLERIAHTHDELLVQTIEEWMPVEELMTMRGKKDSKYHFAHLSKILAPQKKHPVVSEIHLENVNLFLEKYAHDVQELSFIGSYAFNQQEFFKRACANRGIYVHTFIERPVKYLADTLLT